MNALPTKYFGHPISLATQIVWQNERGFAPDFRAEYTLCVYLLFSHPIAWCCGKSTVSQLFRQSCVIDGFFMFF
jgi:hypothetical protein